ncbi:hypothetical protein MmiAt1_01980 [Methanimicrococcus sp. At1]|uniref:Uncharacterized protein n=1 Tax=Methanimicrococcus hacksteinii TaxID=3028293 RepID=A0ABU3VNA6_9EURY|nr:hypothetical protein [Methanimicrococcus sp. At1]MDV0444666.1 hypothetical protein [Methanimicrococcus sp. At1]
MEMLPLTKRIIRGSCFDFLFIFRIETSFLFNVKEKRTPFLFLLFCGRGGSGLKSYEKGCLGLQVSFELGLFELGFV